MESQHNAAEYLQPPFPDGTAARLAWQPKSFGAIQSVLPRSEGSFATDISQRHRAWYERLARRGERLTDVPRSRAASTQHIEGALVPRREPYSDRMLSLPRPMESGMPHAEAGPAVAQAALTVLPEMRSTPTGEPQRWPATPVARATTEQQEPAGPPNRTETGRVALAPMVALQPPLRARVTADSVSGAAPAVPTHDDPPGPPTGLDTRGVSTTDSRTEISIVEHPIARVQLSRQSTGGLPDLMPIAEPEDPLAFPSAEMRATGARGRPRAVPEAAAIERLIERIVRPVSVPGVEFRAIEGPARIVHDKGFADTGSEADESARRRPPPASTTPPPLDINAVADKVYRLLQRRDRFELERRGLY
jgi:hypothetical protein